jgi:hypothetical protein
MPITPPTPAIEERPRDSRHRRTGIGLAAIALATLAGAGCGGPSGGTGASPRTTTSHQSGSGSRQSSSSSSSSGGDSTTGSFSLAFAKCMRTHGVANFPFPNGTGGQLGPGSGIDPNSPAFQSALKGACRILAPPEWLGSGKVTKGGAS